jgi:hypothetical protein
MHWLIEYEGILLLASKLPSSIDLLELFMIQSLTNELIENVGYDWELFAKHTLSNKLERRGSLMWMVSYFFSR